MSKYVDNPNDLFHMRRAENEPVELTATEARQGSLGRRVLMVLVGGILLAFLAWGAAEYFGASIAPTSESTDPATTSSTAKDPIANEKVIDNNQPAGQKIQKSPTIQDSNKL